MTKASIPSNSNFQPCQIVCLEHENTRLYAEIIQVVDTRQVCWVRPLMLTVLPQEAADSLHPSLERPILYDLHQSADLVWPIALFRPALDTEVIPFLVRLDDPDTPLEKNSDANKQLSCFVRQVWQAYKSEF